MAGIASLARLGGRIRSDGVWATLAKAWRDHVFQVTHSVIVEFRPEWRAPLKDTPLPDGITCTVVEPGGTLPPLCDWLAHRRPAFKAMLQDGKTGIFVLEGGLACGCAWISFTDHRDRKAREFYRVEPGEAYHYCWLLDPARRNSKLGMIICRRALLYLGHKGIRRQFGIVDLTNVASYLIQIYFGYRECGRRVTHIYILGTQWTIQSRYTGTLGPVRKSRST
jgi:hypothetical protein